MARFVGDFVKLFKDQKFQLSQKVNNSPEFVNISLETILILQDIQDNLRQNVPQTAWEVKSYKPKSMTLFLFWGFPYHNPQQLMKMQFIITMRADPPEPRPAWRRQVSLEFKQLFGQLLVLQKLLVNN